MSGMDGYRGEIARMFEEASREMETLPAGLRGFGRALLSRSHPLTNGGGTNAICLLLPYWMKESTGASEELCLDLAVGNLYMMFHYFVLDDVMDGQAGDDGQGLRMPLAAGQLLHLIYQGRYARHFPHDSPLWACERRYAEQWAAVVGEEGNSPVDPRDIAALAGKAAPIKLCSTGLLLRAGQDERVAGIETAVDMALALLQLSDDLEDWQEDLAEANRSAFLTLVREKLDVPDSEPLDERLVKQAIYRRGCMNDLADVATEIGDRLRGIPGAPRGLVAFGDEIERNIRGHARAIEEEAEQLARGGGFSLFLSHFIK